MYDKIEREKENVFFLSHDITHRVVGVVEKLIKYVTFNNFLFFWREEMNFTDDATM